MRQDCYWCLERATTTAEDAYGYIRPACAHCKAATR